MYVLNVIALMVLYVQSFINERDILLRLSGLSVFFFVCFKCHSFNGLTVLYVQSFINEQDILLRLSGLSVFFFVCFKCHSFNGFVCAIIY